MSVLTLVGAGGVERAEPHVERTVRLIESLELGAGDFVFLLDENEIREPHLIARGYNTRSRDQPGRNSRRNSRTAWYH